MDPNASIRSSQAKSRGGGDSAKSFRGSMPKGNRGNQRQHSGPAVMLGQVRDQTTVVWDNGYPPPSVDRLINRPSRGGRGRGGRGGGGYSARRNSTGTDEMADLNFENIRRMDSQIKCIIDSSSQVAIFTYADNRWNEALAVGSLFMYERTGTDRLGMVIMNRQSVENWIHTITKNFELVVEKPYWLVKDGESIFCVWFYDAGDIHRLAQIFTRFGYPIVINEGASRMESSLKPPNLTASAGAQKTGETLGDSILAMLTKPKTEPVSDTSVTALGVNLLNLMTKPDPTKIEDSMAYPLPIKPEPVSPLQAFKESPKSKVQLRTPGASSFAEVAARPKRDKERKPPRTSDHPQEPAAEERNEEGATGFTMQTVEQLEKGSQNKGEGSGPPNLGGHGFITHEHLAQKSSPGADKAQQQMTNDLRAKLGLPPCVYSVSPENGEDAGDKYYSDYENFDDTEIKLSPSIVASKSPEFSESNDSPWSKILQEGSVWPANPHDVATAAVHFTSPWPLPIRNQCFPDTSFSGRAHLKAPEQGIASKFGTASNLRYRTIDDIHGKEISEVEPHELEHILTACKEEAHNLKLMPRPGGSSTNLVWTNVARQSEYESSPYQTPPMFPAQLPVQAAHAGILDMALTADQLVKTFKLLLHDEEFVHKFHSAYLQVRSEEGL